MHIQNRLQCIQFNNGNIILQIILGTFHANCLNQRVSKQLYGLHFIILNYYTHRDGLALKQRVPAYDTLLCDDDSNRNN